MTDRFQQSFESVKHEVTPPVKVGMWKAPSGLAENWTPDPQEESLLNPNIRTESLKWFDMNELEENQLLILTLKGAIYGVRRVGDEQMKLWSSRGGINKRPVPFLGKLENFGMVDTADSTPESPEVDFYPGSIALVSDETIAHIAMPYFSFDEEGKLQPPTTVWLGSVRGINIGNI